MFSVKIYNGDNVDIAIKKFMKKTKKSGLVDTFLERRYYKKPSVQKAEARRRRKRVLEKLRAENEGTKD